MAELREEVRHALANLEIADFRYGNELRYEIKPHVNIVTDELHRLTDALDKAEAERDALRARIDGSPSIEISREDWLDHASEISPSFIGMRVAIVPLED